MLADCGVRVGELVKLRINDFEDQSGNYFFKVRGKGARERLVPLDRTLYRRLRRYADHRPGDSDRFFPALRRSASGDYPPLTENGVQQLAHDLAERTGLQQRVTPHVFRHSAATWMLRRGMNPLLVAQVLDHSSLDMIQNVYRHLTPVDAHRRRIHSKPVPVHGSVMVTVANGSDPFSCGPPPKKTCSLPPPTISGAAC